MGIITVSSLTLALSHGGVCVCVCVCSGALWAALFLRVLKRDTVRDQKTPRNDMGTKSRSLMRPKKKWQGGPPSADTGLMRQISRWHPPPKRRGQTF